MALDEQLLRESFNRDHFNVIASALRTLRLYDVWNLQINANRTRIVESFNHTTTEQLSKVILEDQQTTRLLLALHELGAIELKGNHDA